MSHTLLLNRRAGALAALLAYVLVPRSAALIAVAAPGGAQEAPPAATLAERWPGSRRERRSIDAADAAAADRKRHARWPKLGRKQRRQAPQPAGVDQQPAGVAQPDGEAFAPPEDETEWPADDSAFTSPQDHDPFADVDTGSAANATGSAAADAGSAAGAADGAFVEDDDGKLDDIDVLMAQALQPEGESAATKKIASQEAASDSQGESVATEKVASQEAASDSQARQAKNPNEQLVQSKSNAKVWTWHPDKYWPSIFVAVFSRRSASDRRDLLREVWSRADYAQGKLQVRFALCEHEDGLQEQLLTENSTNGDLLIMPCAEGYGEGLLTKKTLAAMQEFQKSFSKSELFMKIDDDTFAAWSRLWPKVAKGWENYTHHMYMGTLKPPSAPSRDPDNAFYEPPSSYPKEMYPRSADGGPGYLLGGALVKRMLDEQIPQKWILFNEDKAVAVWVDELVSLGESVEYINVHGQTGYAMTAEEWDGQLQWFHRGTWTSYPLLLHHRLSGEAIRCLSEVEATKDPSATIDHCFSQTDNTWIPTKFMRQAEGMGAELWLRRHPARNGKRGI